MGYQRAEMILPTELIEWIQEYVDGASIYIPRKDERRTWGAATGIRRELQERNRRIYEDYLTGLRVSELADRYYLSEKSIQRIVREMRG